MEQTYRASHAHHHCSHRLARSLAVVLLCLLALAPGTIAAADTTGPRFSMRPVEGDDPHLRWTLEPGTSAQADVRLFNGGDTAGRALTFAANALTLAGGGFGVALVDDPRDGPTTWVTYPDTVVPLDPGQEHVLPIRVDVPAGTAPGGYIIGLVVQPQPDDTDAVAESGTTGLQVMYRQAMAILIDVPGPRTPSLAIGAVTSFDGGQQSIISIALENTGNVHLQPSGTVTIADATGTELATNAVAFSTFYAQTTSSIDLPVDGFIAPGTYLVSVELTDSASGAHAAVTQAPLVVAARATDSGSTTQAAGSNGLSIQSAPDASTAQSESDTISGGLSPLAAAGIGVGAGLLLAVVAYAVGTARKRRAHVSHTTHLAGTEHGGYGG